MDFLDQKIVFDTQGLVLQKPTKCFFIGSLEKGLGISKKEHQELPSRQILPQSVFRDTYGVHFYTDYQEALAGMYAIYKTRLLAKKQVSSDSAMEMLSAECVSNTTAYADVIHSFKQYPFDPFHTYTTMCSASHTIQPSLDKNVLEYFLGNVDDTPILYATEIPFTHILGLDYLKVELQTFCNMSGMDTELLNNLLCRFYNNSKSFQDWHLLRSQTSYQKPLDDSTTTRHFLDVLYNTLTENNNYPKITLKELSADCLRLEYGKNKEITFLNSQYQEDYTKIIDADYNKFYCYQSDIQDPKPIANIHDVVYQVWEQYQNTQTPHHTAFGPIGVFPY